MLSFYATTYLWDYNINHVLIVVLLMLLRSDAIVVIMIKGFYAI